MVISDSHLYDEVENAEGDEQDEEDGGAVADDDNDAEHGEHAHHPHAQRARQAVVERLDIAREPVDDAADGRRVEERHRRTQHAPQHPRVDDARRPHEANGEHDGERQHQHG